MSENTTVQTTNQRNKASKCHSNDPVLPKTRRLNNKHSNRKNTHPKLNMKKFYKQWLYQRHKKEAVKIKTAMAQPIAKQ
jgi:hypothetical protein